jgi:hypothetical protein
MRWPNGFRIAAPASRGNKGIQKNKRSTRWVLLENFLPDEPLLGSSEKSYED